MGSAGEAPKTGIDTLGEADFHLQRIVFQLTRDICTRIPKAGGGADLRGGWIPARLQLRGPRWQL
jgi:hypothetical protein